MGGSVSREEQKSSQTIVVSGQANLVFDHDAAQWWVIGFLICIAVIIVSIIIVRKIMACVKKIKSEQRTLRAAVVELRATHTA